MNELKSNRGNKKFAFEDNLYCFSKYSNDGRIKFWRCNKRYNNLKARLQMTTERDKRGTTIGIPSHGPNSEKIQVNIIRKNIKFRAERTQETPMVAAPPLTERFCIDYNPTGISNLRIRVKTRAIPIGRL
ncbi:hypothetical protein HZS_943 [Henneguya salminicola]|nr:hypothetical protein HZS_943 [Henneguya salminicola]